MCLRPSGLTAARRDRMDPCRDRGLRDRADGIHIQRSPSRTAQVICRSRRTASHRSREDQRYGTPGRLFTVWFAPQVNMTGVFTGTLAIVLRARILAGSAGDGDRDRPRFACRRLPVDVGAAHGHRSAAELADGVRRSRRGSRRVLQWLSSIAWDALGRTVRWGSAWPCCSISRSGSAVLIVARRCKARSASSATSSSTGCRRS